MNKSILIQCRLSSSRFPKKMLETLGGYCLFEYVYQRCKQSKQVDNVAIITSNQHSDDELYNLCLKKNIPVYRGDLDNVLERYINAANFFKSEIICRVCGDSPFVDIKAIDKMFLEMEKNSSLEYIITKNSLNGFMSEIFTFGLISKINTNQLTNEDLEHVTRYIKNNISCYNFKKMDLNLNPKDLENITLTIDYPADMIVAKVIVESLGGFDFSSKQVVNVLREYHNT